MVTVKYYSTICSIFNVIGLVPHTIFLLSRAYFINAVIRVAVFGLLTALSIVNFVTDASADITAYITNKSGFAVTFITLFAIFTTWTSDS